MTTFIDIVNSVMTLVFRVILWPFRSLDPVWAIIVVALLSGLLMLWIFARVSNQDGIKRARERIRGNLLGVRLFQRDVVVVLRLQGHIFRDLLTYLRHSLAPVGVILLPVLLILIQLNLFFALRPLEPGEQTLLKVRMPTEQVLATDLTIGVTEVFTIETPAVRMPKNGEVAWRLRANQPGRHRLTIEAGGTQIEKELVVGEGWTEISGMRTGNWVDQLLFSGESPMPSNSPLESIEVVYPAQSLSVLGLETDWLVLFFILSIVFAFLLKGFFGVEI